MVGDVLDETRRRVAEAGVETIDEVRAAGRQLVGFSAAMEAEERALKRHLYARLYDSAALTPIRVEAQRIVADLAATFRERPDCLPAGWQRGEGETARLRGIGDYIAGMTDRFAIARARAADRPGQPARPLLGLSGGAGRGGDRRSQLTIGLPGFVDRHRRQRRRGGRCIRLPLGDAGAELAPDSGDARRSTLQPAWSHGSADQRLLGAAQPLAQEPTGRRGLALVGGDIDAPIGQASAPAPGSPRRGGGMAHLGGQSGRLALWIDARWCRSSPSAILVPTSQLYSRAASVVGGIGQRSLQRRLRSPASSCRGCRNRRWSCRAGPEHAPGLPAVNRQAGATTGGRSRRRGDGGVWMQRGLHGVIGLHDGGPARSMRRW